MRTVLVSIVSFLLVSTALAQPDLRDRPNDLWRAGPFISPFHAVRWNDATPQVQVDGAWYELIAVNDVPADKIVEFSATFGADTAQKHFEEDLIELLTRMDHKPGATATLKLKDLTSGKEQVLKDVPMTLENRQALWKTRMERETQ